MNLCGMSRRRWLSGAVASVAGGALAACGAAAGTTNSAPAATKPTGNIEFWQGWSTRTPQLRAYLDQFEKENPGTKVLDTEVNDLGGRPKMVASLLAGTMPDNLMVFKDMYALVVPAKVTVGLNKYIARDKIDMKQFGEGDVKERTFNGELMAMPSASGGSGAGYVLYWNKEHFRQAGLNPEAAPKNWAELEQFAIKLNRPGERVGISPAGRFFPWLYVNNGRLYADDAGKKVGFDSTETRDALRYLQGLIQRQGGADVVEQVGTNVRQNFVAGKFSMVIEADLYPSLLAVDPAAQQLQWGIGLLPHNQANSRAKYTTPSRGGHGYSVTSGAKNPEGAWALAKFLTLSDAQCNFMVKEQGRISTLKRCNTLPEAQKRPEFQVFTKLLDGVVSLPFSPGDDKAVAALEKYMTPAMMGRDGIESAIASAVKDAQFELDEGWKSWKG